MNPKAKGVGKNKGDPSTSASCPAELVERKDLKRMTIAEEEAALVEVIQMVDKPKLNKVPCNFCTSGKLWRYDKMWCEKVWKVDEGFDQEGDATDFDWVRKCIECVMQECGCTMAEAFNKIYEHNGTLKKRLQKTEELQSALRKFKETFAAMRISKTKRQLYELTRGDVGDIFETLLPFIAEKRDALMNMQKSLGRQKELHTQLTRERDPVKVANILAEIQKIHTAVPEIIAFKDAETGEVNWSKWMASTYHDELVGGGRHGGSFRYWFICQCNFGYGQACDTLTTSKLWGRKYQDPGASRNKWKCTACGGVYQTKWGVLIEITDKKGEISYMKAGIPRESVLDIKAREIEVAAKKARLETHHEIYDAIPTFAPRTTCLVGVKDEAKGHFSILDKAFFNTLPVWEWADVLTLGMTMAQGLEMADALKKMAEEKEGIITV